MLRRMTRKEKYTISLAYFEEKYPNAETELMYDSTYQLLVAVILSSQCTDKRLNKTTPALFAQFPDLSALSKATFEELFPLIKSISYPNNKTKHLIGMAQKVMTDFDGEIPQTVKALMTLPGVGRKKDNVITSVLFMQIHMMVDTHIFRYSSLIL